MYSSPKKMIGKLSLFEKSNGILEIKNFCQRLSRLRYN